MCLAVLALQYLPDTPVLITANRDEFHARPAEAVHAWPGQPKIFAGRDLKAGGTWMGVTEKGRYAIITNYRDPHNHIDDAPSRGALVEHYLRSTIRPSDYVSDIFPSSKQYNGFNLIVGDMQAAYYISNQAGEPHLLAPGVYGLSNHL
jgi:uncharacterized protein with NRDE domain